MDEDKKPEALSIEVKADKAADGKSDRDLLQDIADAQYRSPAQQAAAFVHAALEATRAKQNAPEKMTGRRGRQAAA